jgi:hypothetical protein
MRNTFFGIAGAWAIAFAGLIAYGDNPLTPAVRIICLTPSWILLGVIAERAFNRPSFT